MPARKGLKVITTMVRPSQVKELKQLSERLYDEEFASSPSVGTLIRASIDNFIPLPESKQRRLVRQEEERPAEDGADR